MALEQIFKRVKAASKPLALMEDERRNEILRLVAQAIIERQDEILAANAHDLSRMDAANPMYDRLQLTPSRLQSIAADMCNVATLPSPLGRVLRHRVLDNGLELRRVSVPYGVIGMIYEARPNVTFDVFSLCFKSGNACVLKGGRDADETNRAETALIHDVLRRQGVDTAIVELLPATHEATAEMLSAVGYIDLCIPRGGKQLIDFVRNTARIPVIETGAGVVHCYFDAAGDTAMGSRIIENAKTRRCSVCNTLDTLLIHRSRLADLPALCRPLANHGVRLHADPNGHLHRGFHRRSHRPHRRAWQRSQRVHRHGGRRGRPKLPHKGRCRLCLRERTHQLHRRSAVRTRGRNRHQHAETRGSRAHGPRRNDHLQVAHRRPGAAAGRIGTGTMDTTHMMQNINYRT